MCTSGVATGIAVHIAHQVRGPTALCVVVVGTPMRAAVVLRFVAVSNRRPLTTFAAYVLFVYLSLSDYLIIILNKKKRSSFELLFEYPEPLPWDGYI